MDIEIQKAEADPWHGQDSPDVHITIHSMPPEALPYPPRKGYVEAQERFYEQQADLLGEALIRSLPQATRHRLLHKLVHAASTCYQASDASQCIHILTP